MRIIKCRNSNSSPLWGFCKKVITDERELKTIYKKFYLDELVIFILHQTDEPEIGIVFFDPDQGIFITENGEEVKPIPP